jgi:hypothetical protein
VNPDLLPPEPLEQPANKLQTSTATNVIPANLHDIFIIISGVNESFIFIQKLQIHHH